LLAVVPTVLLAALMTLSAAPRLSAQAVAGLGEDAIPIPARGLRVNIGVAWDQWDRRLLPDGTRSPLLDALATSSLGVNQLPSLAVAQTGIRTLAGLPTFDLTLGALEASGAVRRTSTTLQADFGITRRISVGVRVPYVEVTHNANLVLNRNGSGANVGENPGILSPASYTANSSIFVQLGNERTRLLNLISSCGATTAGSQCDAIRADPAAAQALAARVAAFRDAWGAVYGNDQNVGSPLVPVQGGAVHNAVTESLDDIREGFTRFLSTTTLPPIGPSGALLVYGTNGLQRVAQDSVFGVGADTLAAAFRAGMGDVDVEARVLLYDTWNGDQSARLATQRSGVRVMGSAGWRFGTASSAQANEAFALATGDGVNALLLRATTDLVWRNRAWVSATVRSTTPLADNAVVRLPGAGVPEFFFLSAPQAVSRTLGQRLDLEVAPRLNLSDKFGVSATWLYRSFGADRYEPTEGDVFETGSGSAQFGAIGFTYSTLAAFARGKSKFALEVLFAHEVALSASDSPIPSLARDRLELRIFRGFPKR
jgi:hypothetical protein